MRWILLLPLCLASGADATPVAQHQWAYVSDRVMGGVSDGTARMVDGGLHLSGTVSTANNGGFIQVRTTAPAGGLTGAGIGLTVKGNGETYFVHLRTRDSRRPWQYHRAAFTAPADWTDIRLPWDAFSPSQTGMTPFDPTRVVSIGLVAYGADFEADLWIANVGTFADSDD